MIFHLFQCRKTFFDIIYNFDFLRTIFYFGIDVYEHTFDIDENITVEEFSSGEVFENKHFFKKEEKQIKKLQRQLSKKVKGSNNSKKSQVRIAKLFERITNKKDAYIHYVANELLSYFDTIFMEDLNVQGMLRNHHLAKAIQEVGFYKFKETLVNKALVNDKQVVFVDRFYPSSKTCSVCGYKKRDLRLSDREWVCPICGTKHDRDINAAVNILFEGKRMLTAE